MDASLKKKLVLWLNDTGKTDTSLVGGKGANLGEMIQAGFPIPQSFSVTALAYKRQIEQTIIGRKLEELLRNHSHDPEFQSRTAKQLFLEIPMLPEIEAHSRILSPNGQSSPGGRTFFSYG